MIYQCNKGVAGNSIDIDITCQDTSAEVRADIRVDELGGKRIWGQIINCKDVPVANCLVKLVKVTEKDGKQFYEGIAHTITDCEGFYQFDVCEENMCYKIIVNKAITGPEKIIKTGGGNCHACEKGNMYNPCDRQEPIIVPYQPCGCNKLPIPESPCNCKKNIQPCLEQEKDVHQDKRTENIQKPKCNYATYTR